jgi:UDP-2,3-diacylglucosamine hydrolase
VYLFFSDMHFGRPAPGSDREVERSLVACLEHHRGEVRHLFLVGDVFEAYIEYQTLIPKGYTRFLGKLAEYADDGIPISYLVGNHDPWHRDYFEKEFGATVHMNAIETNDYDRTTLIMHGDGVRGAGGKSYWLRPVLRHPLPIWLYRNLLPGDAGIFIARRVNRLLQGEQLEPRTINGLRSFAAEVLSSGRADLVVLAHSHFPEFCTLPGGHYLNLGSWHMDRTYGLLDDSGPQLLRWNGSCPTLVGAQAPGEHGATRNAE